MKIALLLLFVAVVCVINSQAKGRENEKARGMGIFKKMGAMEKPNYIRRKLKGRVMPNNEDEFPFLSELLQEKKSTGRVKDANEKLIKGKPEALKKGDNSLEHFKGRQDMSESERMGMDNPYYITEYGTIQFPFKLVREPTCYDFYGYGYCSCSDSCDYYTYYSVEDDNNYNSEDREDRSDSESRLDYNGDGVINEDDGNFTCYDYCYLVYFCDWDENGFVC
ncbi:uncharacterized protein LOC111632988 isoform X3 [Centruroides sculpturatus]|uniref:uncharacterized protein LOC111632988 isoform X1 n=1 Tax=Centruroides sculpturatus TaxID=218467 RepID=UPI000C6E4BDA|nr:uncharacterized protein LOC111632988 isoform X1 [Centruroides sculpturatus]XP_023233282.1 uncharacterized protein LOC111632988 isoform X2 [Centruroides sculpturatus]XP_023233283.1 uncharacterized protein LOC111632988 isoform X3 [Centruroides sculpturatus]